MNNLHPKIHQPYSGKEGGGGFKGVHVIVCNKYKTPWHSWTSLTHFLMKHFEILQNSKKLQTATEMWLLKDICRLHKKHCGKW